MSCYNSDMRIQVDVGHQNSVKQSKAFGKSNTSQKKSVPQEYLRVACSEPLSIPLTSMALRAVPFTWRNCYNAELGGSQVLPSSLCGGRKEPNLKDWISEP